MPNTKKCGTLIKRLALTNLLYGTDGLALTPLIVGAHGIGKTKIHNEVARAFGSRKCDTIDCSQIGEGDLGGLPFAYKADDGTSEVRFIKYYVFNNIYRLEKEIYNKALNEGFLKGTVKLQIDAEGNEWLIDGKEKKLVRTKIDIIEDGEENKYKFGDELSGETKLKILEAGEIPLKVILMDELNRADNVVFKNAMNVILERTVNGYKLPFWVMISAAINPSSQNSTYATSELDPAQYSRFVLIKAEADFDTWIDYALERSINKDIIDGLIMDSGLFTEKGNKGTEDQTQMNPDPRAWEMVSKIYSSIYDLNSPKFFSADERKDVDNDLRILIRGKVGESAAREIMRNINNKENSIRAEEIITGKEPKIPATIREKFEKQRPLSKKVIADSVARYLTDFAKKEKAAGKKTKTKEELELDKNMMSQLQEFTNLLDPSTQIIFFKMFINPAEGHIGFMKYAKAFSKDILQNIEEVKTAFKDISNSQL